MYTWFFGFLTRPGSDSHCTGYTTRMICYRLLITCTCLSSTNYQSLFLSIPFPSFSAISQMLHNPSQLLTNLWQLQVSICKMNHVWSGSSFGCGPSCFFINPHFPMFFPWFHDDLPWFPYGFPIFVPMFCVCVACTTSCCGPPWCLGGYGSLTNTGISKTLGFIRIASFCSKIVEVYGCF